MSTNRTIAKKAGRATPQAKKRVRPQAAAPARTKPAKGPRDAKPNKPTSRTTPAKGGPSAKARASPTLVVWDKPRPTPGVKRRRMPSAQQIAEMIEQATVDTYNDEEQAVGWHVMIEDNLSLPFTTEVLGVEVEVIGIEMTSRNEIVAVCQRGSKKQRIPILDLELPHPPPEGYGWIEAYRVWCG